MQNEAAARHIEAPEAIDCPPPQALDARCTERSLFAYSGTHTVVRLPVDSSTSMTLTWVW